MFRPANLGNRQSKNWGEEGMVMGRVRVGAYRIGRIFGTGELDLPFMHVGFGDEGDFHAFDGVLL